SAALLASDAPRCARAVAPRAAKVPMRSAAPSPVSAPTAGRAAFQVLLPLATLMAGVAAVLAFRTSDLPTVPASAPAAPFAPTIPNPAPAPGPAPTGMVW